MPALEALDLMCHLVMFESWEVHPVDFLHSTAAQHTWRGKVQVWRVFSYYLELAKQLHRAPDTHP